ncbi:MULTISPECIES: ChbG/HpnK family deacetylase [Acidithrix]|uniref:Uncharacterized protein n=1 Tax=Acidithrix ferrooxidans TaxID=1280514 RepID=A0A0D8HJ20_9ACTN|nr:MULTISPECIES: ChbG/HpnK family deacetylase [Acidithrix]KJF17787.1 hypothetical protein AXFE_12840 [Acidithrix ferrooxidans]CAG4928199.1 unnamed protein product [Acidithrix sp. C25]
METDELLERLGFNPEAKLSIFSCDYLGFSHSFNEGIFESLREGIATTARLIVGAPWSKEVTSLYRGEDIGVSLVFTSSHSIFSMTPLTQSPTLLNGSGEFPSSRVELWEHADTDEVRRECRAQIERAIFMGFDPSHLASEEQALILRPEFFDVLLDIAIEFKLPLRIPFESETIHLGFPAGALAADEGIVSPTHQVCNFDQDGNYQEPGIDTFTKAISALTPGITEISFRPSAQGSELEALMGPQSSHYDSSRAFLTSKVALEIINDFKITPIGYRELKKVQSDLRRTIK